MIKQVLITLQEGIQIPCFSQLGHLGKDQLALFIGDPSYRKDNHLLIRSSAFPIRTGETYVFQNPEAAILKIYRRIGIKYSPLDFCLSGDGTLSWSNELFIPRNLPQPSKVYREISVLEGSLQYSPKRLITGLENIQIFLQHPKLY